MEEKQTKIWLNDIEIEVEYRYSPKKYYDYFTPPDPEEVIIDAIYIEGNSQDILPLLNKYGDQITDEIIEKENRLL